MTELEYLESNVTTLETNFERKKRKLAKNPLRELKKFTGLLNVGCGDQATGDVNCDFCVEDTEQHRHSSMVTKLNLQAIKNFVLCDAQHLPFRDNVFETAFSSEVIEHVKNPFLMLRELGRVSKSKVIVECPHILWERAFACRSLHNWRWIKKHHLNHFNSRWFVREGAKIGLVVLSGERIHETFYPSYYFPLIRFPRSIRITFKKMG